MSQSNIDGQRVSIRATARTRGPGCTYHGRCRLLADCVAKVTAERRGDETGWLDRIFGNDKSLCDSEEVAVIRERFPLSATPFPAMTGFP